MKKHMTNIKATMTGKNHQYPDPKPAQGNIGITSFSTV
jgi:hypothetical protein